MMDLKTHLFIIRFIRIKKQNKGTDYVLSWKSNGVFNSTLLTMNLLEMLYFLVLMIVHHLILTTLGITFYY